MEAYLCPECGMVQLTPWIDDAETEQGCRECGFEGELIEGNQCIRCEGYSDQFVMCDKCLDELDAYAAKALEAIATKEEIDEWCYVHDIRRNEE